MGEAGDENEDKDKEKELEEEEKDEVGEKIGELFLMR